MARLRLPLTVWASAEFSNDLASSELSQLPSLTPSFFAPLTRRMPAANSGQQLVVPLCSLRPLRIAMAAAGAPGLANNYLDALPKPRAFVEINTGVIAIRRNSAGVRKMIGEMVDTWDRAASDTWALDQTVLTYLAWKHNVMTYMLPAF